MRKPVASGIVFGSLAAFDARTLVTTSCDAPNAVKGISSTIRR